MELRSYARILQRRWLAAVVLPLVALVFVVIIDSRRDPQYTAQARVSINRLSDQVTTDDYEFDDYYDFLASDFILDDTVEIVRGNVFAAAVTERLQAQGVHIDGGTVEGSLDASREHRILTIRSTTGDMGLSVIIANVASLELREDFTDYLGVESDPLPITIRPVEVPVAAESDNLQVRLTYLMLVVAAGGLGLLLALGFEYFDDSLTEDNAQPALGIDLLGVVHEDRP
ncbi:hypothetical protein BH23CHL2_BH23CHL2_00230 [soil metagenome]